MSTFNNSQQSKNFDRRSTQSSLWRRIALSACLATILVGSIYTAFQQREDSLLSNPRLSVRMQVMQEHLSTQTQPYIILAGDSHAELLGWDRICGKPIVNLGLSGIAAIDYGKIMSRLVVEKQAEAIVVFLGTNDLSHKLKPSRDKSIQRFENRLDALMDDAHRFAHRIAYADLLPDSGDPRAASLLDTNRATQYRNIAKRVCEKNGCRPIDTMNTPVSYAENGIHIDRSERRVGAKLYTLIEQSLCPGY
jgi:hypothetical protein